jgi:hypothetical protein
MKVFFLDLWLDLREKRLAPVAIVLLAGIIAVPIVLAKNGKPAPAPPPTATTAAAAAAPVVESQPQAGAAASKLQTFSSRDPFEPTGHVATAPTTTPTTSSGGSGTSTTSTPTGGGGGAPNGGGPTTTPTGTPGGGNTGNTTGETKTTLFTYTVDFRFGAGGDVPIYKGVQRLQLIPDDKNPTLVFLGVTTTGKTAVFLVDSNTGVDTPGGKCRPNADQCTFLYLRPDKAHDEAILTGADGTVYHLRLLGINRVSVSSANGNTTTGSGSGSNKTSTTRSPAFTGNTKSQSSSTTTGPTPAGEPTTPSSFQQLFADSSDTGK